MKPFRKKPISPWRRDPAVLTDDLGRQIQVSVIMLGTDLPLASVPIQLTIGRADLQAMYDQRAKWKEEA